MSPSLPPRVSPGGEQRETTSCGVSEASVQIKLPPWPTRNALADFPIPSLFTTQEHRQQKRGVLRSAIRCGWEVFPPRPCRAALGPLSHTPAPAMLAGAGVRATLNFPAAFSTGKGSEGHSPVIPASALLSGNWTF